MKILLTLSCLCMLAACGVANREAPELKSPCVGAEDSPCDRRPVGAPYKA